ncbi:MAG: DUF72 domain-containing protein [Gammaproteobacteria bacterium]|nr:DUF72 domain-containing protein [Gammaproteobacteria bacterium]
MAASRSSPARDRPVPALTLGARGWDHAAWAEQFYPPDLPPDWRLAYYANEFRAALIPASYWAGAGPGAASTWAGEVTGDFRFFAEAAEDWLVPEPAGYEAFLRGAEPLGERLAGVVLRPGAEAWERERLACALDRAEGPHPVHVDLGSGGGSADLVAVVEGHGARPCWHGPGAARPAGGQVGLARVEAGTDLRAVRRALEAFLIWAAADAEAYLFFYGAPPAIACLQQAQTLQGLLGA